MWNIAQEWPPQASMKRALILDRDVSGNARLRWALSELGYQVEMAEDLNAALSAIRASAEPLAVFFNIEAPRETLDGEDFADMLGALLSERALRNQHIFAAISNTPLDVEMILGKILDRLEIPLFAKPCDVVAIEGYLALAAARQHAPTLPAQAEPAELTAN